MWQEYSYVDLLDSKFSKLCDVYHMRFCLSASLILTLFALLSCSNPLSSYQEMTALPKNETVAQYMNPRGYAYAVTERVVDGNP